MPADVRRGPGTNQPGSPYGEPVGSGGNSGGYDKLDDRLREVEKMVDRIDERTKHLATRAWVLAESSAGWHSGRCCYRNFPPPRLAQSVGGSATSKGASYEETTGLRRRHAEDVARALLRPTNGRQTRARSVQSDRGTATVSQSVQPSGQPSGPAYPRSGRCASRKTR